MTQYTIYLLGLFLVLLLLVCLYLMRTVRKTGQALREFAEAVETGDITRKYPENKFGLGAVNKNLNSISESINALNREREGQEQYLREILELVDTGILAYHVDTLQVLWINEALGNILNIPLIKNLKWLQKHDEKLFCELMEIPFGAKQLITIKQKGLVVQILTNASLFEVEENKYKLIAFHNVNLVMEEVEANAWKGLLDVMTHEIMNSVAPVSSLATTLQGQLSRLQKESELDANTTLEDMEAALETIHRRSEGLLRFSENYRSLSRRTVPNLLPTDLNQPVNAVRQLMAPSLEQKGIRIEVRPATVPVIANMDQSLIEQVLINLITNGMYALDDSIDPHIVLYTGVSSDDQAYITVADNGRGVPDEFRNKIFVPFFTTRKGGSGIGLSLSREIVKLHQAELRLQTKEGEGSAFSILFKSLK